MTLHQGHRLTLLYFYADPIRDFPTDQGRGYPGMVREPVANIPEIQGKNVDTGRDPRLLDDGLGGQPLTPEARARKAKRDRRTQKTRSEPRKP